MGAGAHGKITDAGQQTITRLAKQRQPQAFMDTAGTTQGIQGERVLTRKDVGLEFMMNALRLRAGFETALFPIHTGQQLMLIASPLHAAEEAGLLERTLKQIRPTEKGYRFLDDLLALFVND